jgi:predicted MPP superfamily phosphohydrolase
MLGAKHLETLQCSITSYRAARYFTRLSGHTRGGIVGRKFYFTTKCTPYRGLSKVKEDENLSSNRLKFAFISR